MKMVRQEEDNNSKNASIKVKVNWQIPEGGQDEINVIRKVDELVEAIRAENPRIKLVKWEENGGGKVGSCDEIEDNMFPRYVPNSFIVGHNTLRFGMRLAGVDEVGKLKDSVITMEFQKKTMEYTSKQQN